MLMPVCPKLMFTISFIFINYDNETNLGGQKQNVICSSKAESRRGKGGQHTQNSIAVIISYCLLNKKSFPKYFK